jgi:hypothetical protein
MTITIMKVALSGESHWVILARVGYCMGDVSKNYPDKYGFKTSNFTVLQKIMPKARAIFFVEQPN